MKTAPFCRSFLLIMCCVLIAGCGEQDANQLHRFVGKWSADIGENGESQIWIEEWSEGDNNQGLKGTGKIDENGLVGHMEDMTLAVKNGVLTYTVVAHGQNAEEPVDFKLTSHVGNIYKFENPQHDYPQYIIYEFLNDDQVKATVGAPSNGEIVFNFKRI